MNDPIKCVDCNTWWRGEEHLCKTASTVTKVHPNQLTIPFPEDNPKEDKYKKEEYKSCIVTCLICSHRARLHVPHDCEAKKKERLNFLKQDLTKSATYKKYKDPHNDYDSKTSWHS